jgi:hypothetical protein
VRKLSRKALNELGFPKPASEGIQSKYEKLMAAKMVEVLFEEKENTCSIGQL